MELFPQHKIVFQMTCIQICLSQSCRDVEQLRRERGKLLATMSGLKRKVADIEQQEEELLREVRCLTASAPLNISLYCRMLCAK